MAAIRMTLGGLCLAGAGAVAGCVPAGNEVSKGPYAPVYLGAETRLLDNDLVNFLVSMKGARGPEDVSGYARCVAAQYTLIRGYGFARHVRTNVAQEGGVWRADAVYTISPALPRGLRTLDAEVVVEHCGGEGIPTV